MLLCHKEGCFLTTMLGFGVAVPAGENSFHLPSQPSGVDEHDPRSSDDKIVAAYVQVCTSVETTQTSE
jgi:hypothetical protein